MRWISLLAIVCPLLGSGFGHGANPLPPTISTARVDNTRDGWTAQEYVLTPANVAAHFGQLGSYTTDGFIFAQPIYVPAVITSGVQHDLVIVATMNNSVYAFDANAPGSAAVWNVNLGTARTTYPSQDPDLYGGKLGILSAPVADVPNNHLFVVSATPTPSYTLYELNLATGATIAHVTITGQVTGSGDPNGGDCTSGSNVVFCPEYESQRTALTLANANVYIGFGSFGDVRPWHGWIFAYSTSSLSQVGILCTTPSGYGGGVWQAAGGFPVDSSGYVYAFTGNGTYDGIAEWGESMLKLSSTLAIEDWFTPSNNADLTASDLDLASGSPMLIPNSTHLFGSGKDSRLIMVDTSDMGHLQGSGTAPAQVFTFGSQLLYEGVLWPGMGAYFQNSAFSGETSYPLWFFAWQAGTFNSTAVQGSSYGFPGGQYAGSSNGLLNGILWSVSCGNCNGQPSNPPSGTLYALNSTTLQQIYSDSTVGKMSKFSPPLIANGRVYVVTQSDAVVAYGIK
jgi:hypothetical protein